jgi:hypothetical protein
MTLVPEEVRQGKKELRAAGMVSPMTENTGSELVIPDQVGYNESPTAEGLRLLREEIDPEAFYI